MKYPRRDFIKKVGIGTMATMSFPKIISASDFSKTEKNNTTNSKLTILFQGDSITDGNRTRDNDWNHVMGHGYASLIASRLWYDFPDQNLMFYNRGISGNRIKDLENRWQQDALDLKPDIISILIGVNDVIAIVKNNDPESLEQFESHYRNILNKTKQELPNCKLVLCECFTLPLGWLNEKTAVWNAEIPKRQQLLKQLAKEYNAVFVPLQQLFVDACKKAPADYWIWDGVHPMPGGHELIARQWIKEIKKIVPFIKSYGF